MNIINNEDNNGEKGQKVEGSDGVHPPLNENEKAKLKVLEEKMALRKEYHRSQFGTQLKSAEEKFEIKKAYYQMLFDQSFGALVEKFAVKKKPNENETNKFLKRKLQLEFELKMRMEQIKHKLDIARLNNRTQLEKKLKEVEFNFEMDKIQYRLLQLDGENEVASTLEEDNDCKSDEAISGEFEELNMEEFPQGSANLANDGKKN